MELVGFIGAATAATAALRVNGGKQLISAKRNCQREWHASGGNGREGKTKRRLWRGNEQCGGAKRALQARWAGMLLAESTAYEFMDGRFYFPADSVRWEFVKRGKKTRHHNPVGRLGIHDIVKRDERGVVVARNRGAVMSFQELKRPFEQLEGYTYFWKGVEMRLMEEDVCRDDTAM